jgi:peroxiredoxin
VGKKAPEFTLTDHLDRKVSLMDYCGQNVVLFFFPLAFTPV